LNIAIITTVINFELYDKTAKHFPPEISRYVIDGRNGMHGIHSIEFMMKKLKAESIDWIVMCDEDVIWKKTSLLFDMIDYMANNNYMVSGVRDGGVIAQRVYNPYVINTFFSVLHFSGLQKIWNKREIRNQHTIIEKEFDDNIDNLLGNYDSTSSFEPYYSFYLWLRRKKENILFLDAAMTVYDELTNSVLFNNQVMLYHTWYARSYGSNPNQTKRINNVLEHIHPTNESKEKIDYIYFKDPYFSLIKKMRKQQNRFTYKLNSLFKP